MDTVKLVSYKLVSFGKLACLLLLLVLSHGCSAEKQAASAPAIESETLGSQDSAQPTSPENDNRENEKPGNEDIAKPRVSSQSVPVVNGPAMPKRDTQAAASRSKPSQEASVDDAGATRVPAEKASEMETVFGRQVNVFFATDRLPTAELLPGTLRTFMPAISVVLICVALLIGLVSARRYQVFWLLGNGLAICLGMTVLHSCIISWQQYTRLASDAGTQFSTQRYDAKPGDYPLHVGTATVSVPQQHVKGQVESPSLLRLEFVERPDRHIVLQKLDVDAMADNWFHRISEQVQFATEREGFIFIHGYNVKFASALKRTAQLAVDLEVDGPVISYSWPSRGQVAAYTVDEATVSWSAPHFEKLLIDLRSRTDCRTFNIVAHSMGNRALLEAIERINLRMNGKPPPSGQPKFVRSLVLAAPDVDAGQFGSRYVDAINNVAEKTTVYFSDNDRALQLSQGIHGAARLGIYASQLGNAKHLDAIHIGTESLFSVGHSYYGSDPVVLDDIRRVLHERSKPSDRAYLKRVEFEGSAYWEIDRGLHARAVRAEVR